MHVASNIKYLNSRKTDLFTWLNYISKCQSKSITIHYIDETLLIVTFLAIERLNRDKPVLINRL